MGGNKDGADAYYPRHHLIAGTRIALGAGIGLLLSRRLNNDQRKAAGLALALVGGLILILNLSVIGKKSAHEIRRVA